MAKNKRTYRRFIRLGGRLEASPEFTRKVDADNWYDEQKRLKKLEKSGVKIISDEITFLDYTVEFINKRLETHCYSTFVSDEQRLRDYLLPSLKDLPINKITTQKIKRVLKNVTDMGRAVSTRDRVKALASSIFAEALNEEPPLVSFNPVRDVKFSEGRKGQKKPKYFPHIEEVETFLSNAKKLGPQFLSSALLAVTSGLRKSEILGLKWKDLDFKHKEILISKRVIQASLEIEDGTKSGSLVQRKVPMGLELSKALKEWRKKSKFNEDDDFIFTTTIGRDKGRFLNPRTLSDWHERCLEGVDRRVTVHGLRHTFGREFVKRGGNIKRLQAILGHSSIATTSIYSDLAEESHSEMADFVNFKVKGRAKKRKR